MEGGTVKKRKGETRWGETEEDLGGTRGERVRGRNNGGKADTQGK
jgi:hypothetical protein